MLIKLFIAFLLLLLLVRFFFFYQKSDVYQDGQYINFEATLLSEPQFTATYQKLSVSLPLGGTAYLIVARFPEYGYGDSVDISGPIRILHQSRGLQPRAPGGQSYMASSRIFKLLTDKPAYSMYFPKISLTNADKSPILAVSIFFRQKVTGLFNKTLPPDLSSLLLGVVLGVKGQMSKDFSDNLRLAGVLHVIAASGMNVTMVAGFLSSVFVVFLKRQEALFASILGIVFYAFLAGLQPSIIRASIMGVLVFSSQILGRQSFAAYGLFLTGFLMLFVSPFLILDIGFQLSFTATAGLLYIRPLFNKINKIKILTKKLPFTEDFFITLSAQIATFPVLLSVFGTYSLWSVFVNSLVLWTVPPMMVLGGLGGVLGIFLEPVGRVFVYSCLPLLMYFQAIISFFASKGGIINIVSMPWQFILGYYLLLLSLIHRLPVLKNG